MWVTAKKMEGINIDIKTRPYQGAEKWQHKHITDTMGVDILFADEQKYLPAGIPAVRLNWRKDDYRHPEFPNRWFMNYWEQTELVQKYSYYHEGKGKDRKVTGRYLNPKYKTKQELYEDALEDEILKAIARLDAKWAKKMVKDYEQAHQDPLVKFVKGQV